MRDTLAAEGTISSPTVFITDEKEKIHGTASFIGDRGYLLTAFNTSNPSKLPKIGSTFETFYLSNSQRKKVSAAVVDVNHGNGISLLRLTNTAYPNDKPLLTSESMKLPFDLKDMHPCTVHVSLAESPYLDKQDCKIVTQSEDGTIRINLASNSKAPSAGLGAPVYADDKLIGLVSSWDEQGSWARVYPINHAISYLMMAEGTILGKDTILRIVEQVGLMGEFQNFLESVRRRPQVQVKIEPKPLRLVATSIKPYGIEHDVKEITAEAYPTWRHIKNKKPQRYTWSQIKEKAPKLALRFKLREGKEIPDKDPWPLCYWKLALLKAVDFIAQDVPYDNSMRDTVIESFHVEYSWVVSGKNQDGTLYSRPESSEGILAVEDEYCGE